MTPSETGHQLDGLSEHLADRRQEILLAWRAAVAADPGLPTAQSLSRTEFAAHMPEILAAFGRKLRSPAGDPAPAAEDGANNGAAVSHGLDRWEHGYPLHELLNEWGHLQLCLFDELHAYAATHPDVELEWVLSAQRQALALLNGAISASAAEYERKQQSEASTHVNDLMSALASVREQERTRSALIHQAVHDLGSNVHVISATANLLGEDGVSETERKEFAGLLQEGVHTVGAMFGELLELARLEAGQERREITGFDAAALIMQVCNLNQPVARERGLFLKTEGPAHLTTEGDAVKLQRLLQNLLRNGLNYTARGGVTVSWGEEPAHWWLLIKDTGPGLLAGSAAPMIVRRQESSARAMEQLPGQGIGLSIVKRLCELLAGNLEISSSAELGTSVRAVFPRAYPHPVEPRGSEAGAA